ncbi:unnamed protein product [Urochloa decumbens]|uniref:F-box domain-containing protein n=1 Tax=Urochloa decumbens TaxID=240449 RepID=A0ABC9D5P0_9POAL
MEAAAKRARAGGGSAPDRLSALSDELLRHVLCFLPSRQAVQTTVLSKRWVDLWRSVPAINLDSTDFRGADWGKSKDFTTNLLMLHNAQFLDVVRLWFSYMNRVFSYPGPDMDRWVRRVIKHHPLVLDINIGRSFRHEFQIPLVGSAFGRLKTLRLGGVCLDHSFAERLNSGCPVLEDLVLDYCRNEFDAIRSDTLKNLVVRTCSSNVAGVLIIRAPCLASLSLHFPYYYYRNGLLLAAGNSLARASISSVGDVTERGQAILLRSLFNVTSLELYGFSAVAFLDKALGKFPIFDNLRTLSLNRCFLSERDVHKFKALGRFLQKSPNLEKLNLKNFWYFEGIERKEQSNDKPRLKTVRPVVGPIEFPILENLRTLVLDECDLRDSFRILRHFLRSSPNLEKLTVQCCELPEGSVERKGKAKKTHFQSRNLVRFQCLKLKSTEIIYKKGGKVKELVSFLLDISERAPMNSILLTQV